MPFLPPNQQRQSTEGTVKGQKLEVIYMLPELCSQFNPIFSSCVPNCLQTTMNKCCRFLLLGCLVNEIIFYLHIYYAPAVGVGGIKRSVCLSHLAIGVEQLT